MSNIDRNKFIGRKNIDTEYFHVATNILIMVLFIKQDEL